MRETNRKLEDNIIFIHRSKLKPFQEQPYKVLMNESMDELVNSIRLNGVLMPIIVRKLIDGQYEIVSGEELPAFCYGNTNLYMQCKEDDENMVIGLWNFFEDEAIEPIVLLSREYQEAEFLCGSGELSKDRIRLTDIPPYAFRGIVLKK